MHAKSSLLYRGQSDGICTSYEQGWLPIMRICFLQLLQRMAGVVFLTLLAAVAVAQTPEARIEIAIERAQEAGIPISLLESKRAEGKAKGIPIERIATAVETRLQHLERARQAIGRGATDL